MPVDADTLQRLYTLPPEEFVAARNALAKELRAAKDRDAASEVAKLRRPSVVDWALNVVARDRPAAIATVLDAAEALRAAQSAAVEGRPGADVRVAVREMRTSTQPLLAAADDVVVGSGRVAGSQTAALTARLTEVAGNAAASEQLRAGRLGSAELDAVDPFGGLEQPAGGSRPERAPAPQPRVAPAERREHRRAVAAAQRQVEAARSARSSARTALDRAEAAAARASAALDDARTRYAAAEQRVEETEAELVAVQDGES